MLVRRGISSLAVMVGLAACSAAPLESPAQSSSQPVNTPSASETTDSFSEPSLDGKFAVDETGRELAITCWGSEEPTIIIEGGDPDGRDNFGGTAFVRALGEGARVCLYDRAGGGDSDPAPNEPRNFDAVVDYLHALLTTAQVVGPKVLVGSSFGGNLMVHYAARHPEDVVGVVLIDTPAPEVFTVEEFPEGAWDYPGNVEHINLLEVYEPQPFEAPLLCITASEGQSSVDDQGYWLSLSADAEQVELAGGHDLYEETPDVVAAEILSFLRDRGVE